MSMSINSATDYSRFQSNYTKNDPGKQYQRLSSGYRINSAADDAAGLAIAVKMLAQNGGTLKGIDNALDMKNALNTAEGAMSTISDAAQRLNELSIQASNGIYEQSDRQQIDFEVQQLVDHINSTAKNTQFNKKNLTDGSFVNQNAAISANGTGMTVNVKGVTAEDMGLVGFSVANKDGKVDIDAIANALDKVSSARSEIGAQMNRLDHSVNASEIAAENQAAAISRIRDQDMAKGVSDLTKNQLAQQYSISMQKMQMQSAANILAIL